MSEVVFLNQVDQFIGDHTISACGFFAIMVPFSQEVVCCPTA